MPDWQVGYPPTPTLANRGDGRTRVTFAAWELDSWFFDQITTAGACYLQNVTLAQVSQIVGKGGTERTGYWFDCQVAFGVWAAGNRIAPQRSAAVNWNTTVAAAFAAAAAGDSLLCWYRTTTNTRWWQEVASNAATVKCVDFFGMLPRRKLFFYVANNFYFYNFSGAIPALGRKVRLRNITLTARNGGTSPAQFIQWNDTAGAPVGTGVVCDSIDWGGGASFASQPAGIARAIECWNCMIWSCSIPTGGAMGYILYHNTFYLTGGVNLGALAYWAYNNVSLGTRALQTAWTNIGGAVFFNNGSWDATGSAGLQNLLALTLPAWYGADYGYFQKDRRLAAPGTPLVGGGSAVPALPIDCDNNPRSLTAPTVGAHEGTQKAYQNYVPPRPQNFSITNLGTDSDLLFTWSNGADYLPLDDMVIFSAAGLELGRTAAVAGQITIGGLVNQAVYSNVYARAISDNGVLGPASALQSNTPTQRIVGRTTIHLTCDAADDDSEDVYRYYWFIGTSLAATQALRTAVQAMIDSRLPLTGFAAVTDEPDLEQAGYVTGNPAIDYWGFVVAMDEDGTCTPTAPADIVHIIANPGSGTLTANTHIRVMEAVEPALYPIM